MTHLPGEWLDKSILKDLSLNIMQLKGCSTFEVTDSGYCLPDERLESGVEIPIL